MPSRAAALLTYELSWLDFTSALITTDNPMTENANVRKSETRSKILEAMWMESGVVVGTVRNSYKLKYILKSKNVISLLNYIDRLLGRNEKSC